jgi:hypothetical protein
LTLLLIATAQRRLHELRCSIRHQQARSYGLADHAEQGGADGD